MLLLALVTRGTWFAPYLLFSNSQGYSYSHFHQAVAPNHEQSSDMFFVYLKCESVGYWFIVIICQNQLTIFIHIRSATITHYTVINYLLQALVFLAKIGIHGIISGSKNSKLIFLDYKLLTHHMKRYLTGLFDILTLHSIRFSSIPLINFI